MHYFSINIFTYFVISISVMAPWRIVMPALFFNLIFAMVAMYAVHDLVTGFTKFQFDIQNLFSDLVDSELISNQVYVYIMSFIVFKHT